MLQTSRFSRFARAVGALAAAATLFTACEQPVAPSGAPSLTTVTTTQLLLCPNSTAKSTSKLILPLLGGIVSLDGSLISIPSWALSLPTVITVAIPTSDYMQVDITAGDLLSFLFRRSVQVTVDYSRCGDVQGDLTVWHIDPATKAFLEDMGGTDNRSAHKITFTTNHLSSYAIANRTTTEIVVEP
ncbi:MAG TPA: hypothetical protein VKA84_01640 [Gemmatimonadaceae bacterium]|nr:hypothetical protein [Gemmatimonadaceae bacterium]